MNRHCAFIFVFGLLSINAKYTVGQNLTYFKDIAPIIAENCMPCHSPDNAAPFSLTTPQEVIAKSKMIKYVVEEGIMPPWKADTTFRRFVDERILSADDISKLIAWVDGGATVGNKKDAPENMEVQSVVLGKPDVTLKIEQPFKIKPTQRDTVVYFPITYHLPSDTNVLAFEFVPGNYKAVHHSNCWIYDLSGIKMKYTWNYAGLDTFGNEQLRFYDGWVPGSSARTWPDGFGFRIPKDGVLLMQLHYAPSSVELLDQSYVNIYFTDKRAKRQLALMNIGSGGGIAEPEPELIIPPDSIKSFIVHAHTKNDLSYLYLNAHMHYLGKTFVAYAVTPRMDTIPLVRINDWDFKWQEFYKPRQIIKIPAGSDIYIKATYDNTASNPNNPNIPPVLVKPGPNSHDEMLSMVFFQTTYMKGDESIELKSEKKRKSKR